MGGNKVAQVLERTVSTYLVYSKGFLSDDVDETHQPLSSQMN